MQREPLVRYDMSWSSAGVGIHGKKLQTCRTLKSQCSAGKQGSEEFCFSSVLFHIVPKKKPRVSIYCLLLIQLKWWNKIMWPLELSNCRSNVTLPFCNPFLGQGCNFMQNTPAFSARNEICDCSLTNVNIPMGIIVLCLKWHTGGEAFSRRLTGLTDTG